ncbi:MAG: hypothetical protein RHS_5423 [Robinsoniella sp. RHS]|nr:MAG: hypothetical protein RHS_5423 [Robinsoniella sp. RHS]
MYQLFLLAYRYWACLDNDRFDQIVDEILINMHYTIPDKEVMQIWNIQS